MRNAAVAQLGASGAGKSTVLNILGGMDTNSEGQVIIDGKDISSYTVHQLTDYRRTDIGFVFQFYNLVANLTAKENVELASEIVHDAQDPTQALIDVGLKERIDNFPAQLSGGEQQRGAVDMYFTEGMTIRKVVAELGYPSEGALAKWVREDPARHVFMFNGFKTG